MGITAESVVLQNDPSQIEKNERSRIVELVRRFGGCTTDAVLDPSMQFFELQGTSGFISYRLKAGCVVIFGDPVCSEKDKVALATAFHNFAKEKNKRVVYIAASEPYTKWAIEHVCKVAVQFGEEFILDPLCDPRKNTGTHGSLVRRKVKSALREGVTIHEYVTKDREVEKAIEEVGEQWLKSRRGPQVHISNVYLFEDRIGKRWLYAKKDDKIIGIICLNQLEAYQGWLLNHLMNVPGVPSGTSELLVVSALETLAKEGCRFATVGIVAGSELENIMGLSKPLTWLPCGAFKLVTKAIGIDGLNTFWGKFHPRNKPLYLLFSHNHLGLREVLALKSALNGKS